MGNKSNLSAGVLGDFLRMNVKYTAGGKTAKDLPPAAVVEIRQSGQ